LRRLRNQVVNEGGGTAEEENVERLGRLPSDVKVSMTVDMTDAMVKVCIAGIKAHNPNLTDDELIMLLRERFEWAKTGAEG